MPAAADKLLNDLAVLEQNKDFQGVQSLVFITHSTGGLVVKEMLRKSHEPLMAGLSSRASFGSNLRSPWMNTRFVINFDVPHKGGDWFYTTVASLAYPIFYTHDDRSALRSRQKTPTLKIPMGIQSRIVQLNIIIYISMIWRMSTYASRTSCLAATSHITRAESSWPTLRSSTPRPTRSWS